MTAWMVERKKFAKYSKAIKKQFWLDGGHGSMAEMPESAKTLGQCRFAPIGSPGTGQCWPDGERRVFMAE